MNFRRTSIPEVLLVEPRVFEDARGSFMETWEARKFAEAGIGQPFVQDNQSRSARWVLRGLHYQVQVPQGKLVRVLAGKVFDVAVDLRRSSPTFGRWVGETLSAENRRMLWIPPGFAHGFIALENNTDLAYKCTQFYAARHERSLAWNDPALGIEWPIPGGVAPILSEKDAAAPLLAGAETYP
jgi:dTDP-4-dehydrorhamnose 3,5-epimerase